MEGVKEKILNFLKNNWQILAVLLIALLVRTAYHLVLHPPLSWFDSSIYDQTAWNMVTGNGYSVPGYNVLGGNFFTGREPGYALLFLAPIYFMFGHSILAAQILQGFLSIIIITLIYLISRKFFDKKIALLAAMIYAFLPTDIAFGQEILTEIPFSLLFISSVYFIIDAINNRSIKKMYLAGFFLGLATLTRFVSVLFPFALVLFFYLYFKSFKQAIRWSLPIFVGVIVLVLPWVIVSSHNAKAFVFGRTGSLDIYWSASYVPWDGDWLGYETEPLKSITKMENATEREALLKRMIVQNFRDDPIGVAKVWLKKPYKIFVVTRSFGKSAESEGVSGILNSSQYMKLALKSGLQLWHLCILLFSFGGIFMVLRKSKDKLLASLVLTILLYFIVVLLPMNTDPRYQIPVMPYFVLFAAVGMWKAVELIKNCFGRFVNKNGIFYSSWK